MSKTLVLNVSPYAKLYRDNDTGIAWIEDGSTGLGHSAHPNIDVTGSVKGMKERGYWDKDDQIVKSHGFYYDISKFVATDDLDNIVADYCLCEECRKRRGIEHEI